MIFQRKRKLLLRLRKRPLEESRGSTKSWILRLGQFRGRRSWTPRFQIQAFRKVVIKLRLRTVICHQRSKICQTRKNNTRIRRWGSQSRPPKQEILVRSKQQIHLDKVRNKEPTKTQARFKTRSICKNGIQSSWRTASRVCLVPLSQTQ